MKNIKELEEQIQRGKKFNYIYFWGHRQKRENTIDKSCLSQWYPRGFEIDEVYYRTAEHYMMAEKARLFEPSCVDMILASKTTKEVKLLGRSIKNFDDKIWSAKSFDIVVQANIAKFSQHQDLKEFLLYQTGKKVFVEASPYDKVWGVGMLENSANISNPLKWNGLNKLGFALMVVREELLGSQI